MSGTSIERESSDYISKEWTIKPLKDRIFIRPLDWDASRIIVAIREGRPVRGEAIACGPGAYRTRRSEDKTKLYQTDTFIPMSVKPGDIVELGGLNIFDGKGYSFDTINYGGEQLLVITEKDVCMIRE